MNSGMSRTAQRTLGEWAINDEGENQRDSDSSDEEDVPLEPQNHPVRVAALPKDKRDSAERILRGQTNSRRMPICARLIQGQEQADFSSDSDESVGEDEDDSEQDEDGAFGDGRRHRKTSKSQCLVADALGSACRLSSFLPVLEWLPSLTCATVRADLIAGVTVGVMAIPQSMSYANIAGLPYIYGLYAACVPALVYALLGQSRQLAVGPVAMVSLLVQAGLNGILTKDQCPEWYAQLEAAGGDADLVPPQSEVCVEVYCNLAFLTSALVGVVMVLGSVLRLSFLVCFLGHPVISGFTSGSAIIIGLSQVKYFLGVDIPKSQHLHVTLCAIVARVPDAKPAPLLLGCVWVAFLFGCKKLAQRRRDSLRWLGPLSPLIGCCAGTVLMMLWPALHDKYHVKRVGTIDGGLFPPSLEALRSSAASWRTVSATALSASLIGFMESVAIGKNLAMQHRYELDAGQEMLAIGVANLVGSTLSCYPVTGSFSRSAVANSTGALTQFAGFVTGLVMLSTMLYLTRLFYDLPMFVLAAVVVNSVLSLIYYDVAIELWSVAKHDFLLWVVAFLGTLFLGPLEGIALAVLMSLILVINESVRPQITILWRIPGTNMYRPLKQEGNGQFVPGILIARIGASLYFANASFVKDRLLKYVASLAPVDAIHYVVLEMTPVVTIDSTACHVLEETVSDFRRRDIQVAFAMVGNRVEKTMESAQLRKLIGEQWFFPTVAEAVHHCLYHKHVAARGTPDAEGRLDALTPPGPMLVGNEVGFSNEVHHTCTAVYVSLEQDVLGIQDEILSTMRGCEVLVKGAEADGKKHTYLVVSARHQQKLVRHEMEQLRAELEAVFVSAHMRQHRISYPGQRSTGEDATGTSGGTQELELALAEELAKVDEGLRAQQRARELNQALMRARRVQQVHGGL